MRAPRYGAMRDSSIFAARTSRASGRSSPSRSRSYRIGIRLADQPLERASEPRELGDTSRGEQLEHVPSHGIE